MNNLFRNTFLKSMIGFSFIVMVLFFNNCRGKSSDVLVLDSISPTSSSQNVGGSGAAGTLCEQDIKNLFDRGWHDFTQKNCTICHSNGPGKGRFANPDLEIAYADFMQVGFTNVGDHAVSTSHNPPYTGVQNIQDVNVLKLEWQKGLQQYATCTGDSTVLPTESQISKISLKTNEVVTGLAADGDKKVITWTINSDLTRVKGTDALPNISGGKISMTVTRLKNASGFTYYTFSSPTIWGASVDTRVQGIFVNINGFLLNYPTTFSFIDKSIRGGSMQADLTGLVSTGSLVAPKVIVPTDTISLSFIDITQVTMPPAPPPTMVNIGGAANVVVTTGTDFIDIPISLSAAAIEPVIVTLAENSDLCGTASTYVNSNTLFKTVSGTCLPDVYNTVCPSGSCVANAKDFGRARSIVGTTWNRYDWDYKLPSSSVSFNVGESSKTIRLYFSKNSRLEKNRVLTLNINSVLGSVNIGSKNTINYIINKYNNPIPNSNILTFSELMNPTSGILGQNCVKCHNSSLTAGGYDMTNYDMMIAKGVLIPGDVNSKMYVRMHPNAEFLAKPMPQDGFLTQPLILEVEKWLLDGAKNN